MDRNTGSVLNVFVIHALMPILFYIGYLFLVVLFSHDFLISDFKSEFQGKAYEFFGYRDAGSLFTWLALIILALILSILTVIVACKQLLRRVPVAVLSIVVLVFSLFAGLWVFSLMSESNTALRLFAYGFSYDYLNEIYKERAPYFFFYINILTRIMTAVVFPAGMLGAVATASLLLLTPPKAMQAQKKSELIGMGIIPNSLKSYLEHFDEFGENNLRKEFLSEDERDHPIDIINDLKHRTDAGRNLILLGSGMLTVASLFTHVWLTWPSEFFVDKADSDRLNTIAAGYTFFSGIGISMLIAMIYVPVMIQLKRYCLCVARAHGQLIYKDQLKWLHDRGITFMDPSGLKEIIVMLSPLLAAPIGAILQRMPSV